MTQPGVSTESTLTVHVPLSFRRHGGRKVVIAPDGHLLPRPLHPRVDGTMVKALTRAHRWKRMLETGRHQTLEDLAVAEKINASYVARILRLTLLAPDIVERILDGRQPKTLTLARLMQPFPFDWERQRRDLKIDCSTTGPLLRTPWSDDGDWPTTDGQR